MSSAVTKLTIGLRVVRCQISSPITRHVARAGYATVNTSGTTAAKIPSYYKPSSRSASASASVKAVSPKQAESSSTAATPNDVDADAIERASEPPTPTAESAAPWTDGIPSDIGAPEDGRPTDWSRSYHGLSSQPFSKEIAETLMAPIEPDDVEIKPDGLLYLPEIKYRRILNRAFGPGGWGLAPRSETNVSPKVVSREYALVCLGRLVAIARGEQEYFDPSGIATATEACKSNALMRCCKDLGIASELWDPRFIREFKSKYCVDVFATHVVTQRKKKLWRRKDAKIEYPYKE